MYTNLHSVPKFPSSVAVVLPSLEVRGKLLTLHADLPAKAVLLNMNQFNGSYPCSYCLHSGNSIRTENGGNIRVFPLDPHNMSSMRTHDSIQKNVPKAVESKKNCEYNFSEILLYFS